jgi:hypothetical protein
VSYYTFSWSHAGGDSVSKHADPLRIRRCRGDRARGLLARVSLILPTAGSGSGDATGLQILAASAIVRLRPIINAMLESVVILDEPIVARGHDPRQVGRRSYLPSP